MSKTAVVIYSYTNNTKKIAEMIHEKIDAEIIQIEKVTPYRGSYEEVVDLAKKEVKAGFKPSIQALGTKLDEYDTIILGTPVWWYTMAPAVLTFLSDTDLRGKRIIPFATNAGWLGHTFEDIKKHCPGSEVLNEMNIEFSEDILKTTMNDLEQWIQSI
ncbi:MAG: flavodoxin [Clostridiaceae bacterium]